MLCIVIIGTSLGRKKPISALRFLQTRRPFSSHNLAHRKEDITKLTNALRVLDLISIPNKTSNSENRRIHLRLIDDSILQINKNILTQASDDNSTRPVFDRMLQTSANLPILGGNVKVLSRAVSKCGSEQDIRSGILYHCLAMKSGFGANIYVGSSLITMYSKCALLEDAYRVFEEMPVRNVVSWTAIIAGFAQEWQIDVCLELFEGMRTSGLKPNDFTFTSLLSACTGSGALGQGRSAHCQLIHMGFCSSVHVANALITMYCKCGEIEDASSLFKRMCNTDVVSWNSMITGYAQHGLALEAIDLFENMKKQGIDPDAISYLGILSSCRHAGLVEEGRIYLNLMAEHGVKPEVDHFSCVVDLFGRAGLLQEALDVIQSMPVYPNAVIWGSLLSSCRLHGNGWIGIQAAEERLKLEPGCPATLVQLTNLYASLGWWEKVAQVRKLMKNIGRKTNPGYSWIEVKNKVYRFGAEDGSNTRITEIFALIESLIEQMKGFGFEPELYERDEDPICAEG